MSLRDNMSNNNPKTKFSLYEYRSKVDDQNILVSYKGPFTGQILKDIGEYISDNLQPNAKASKKLFKIFIELAQNISYYSAEANRIGNKITKYRVGSVVIGELDNHYFMTTGNRVSNKSVSILSEKCDYINSLQREDLRKYKREQRNMDESEFGGANIGLITVALTSDNPLDVEVEKVDDSNSFFSLTVYINK